MLKWQHEGSHPSAANRVDSARSTATSLLIDGLLSDTWIHIVAGTSQSQSTCSQPPYTGFSEHEASWSLHIHPRSLLNTHKTHTHTVPPPHTKAIAILLDKK